MPDILPTCDVHNIETIWIPMSDGTRLAARLWLPEGSHEKPVPAILEYIPYRRRDGSRDWDQLTHPWIAAQGYACLRLDIRGSGDSEGVIFDEYLKQEQDDAIEAIEWIAAQPWCSGKVGMMGISWGGFNSLQVAARRPPALKAIITVCSTDDRYADDIHYMGGCLLNGNLDWGATFFTYMGRAPDPDIVGERWREMWLERLEQLQPFYTTWMEHQHRDEYWSHGSVSEDFGQIECAVMAVGGWADGYSNTPFRMLQGLSCPRQAIIGPWGHKYPHMGAPGPAIGFLQEAVRWWDLWLKGKDTGIMNEPMLRAYVQDSAEPRAHYDERPGHWVGEDNWPSPFITSQRFHLDPAGLVREATAPEGEWLICSPQSTGSEGGEWCPYGLGGLGPEMPLDQRPDDGRSLVFDTPPLAGPLEILGAPTVSLNISADRPNAIISVRLCDVAPNGSSTRVTFGILNLTHRDGHATPQPLQPGRRYLVRLQLNEIGYSMPAGHRLRIALSTAYWPMIWPSPEAVQLSVFAGESELELPVRRPRPSDADVRFEPPLSAPALALTAIRPGTSTRRTERDIATGVTRMEVLHDDGAYRIEENGIITECRKSLQFRIADDDPASARAEAHLRLVNGNDAGWSSCVETRSVVSCSASAFVIEADVHAFEGERRIFSRSWNKTIPRRLL